MNEMRQHVLVWVSPEFLQSSGMILLFTEAGLFSPPDGDLTSYIEAAIAAGGFAMTGRLSQAGHGAGIWVSPVTVPGLEVMIPWQFVKSVVTAASSPSANPFGLGSGVARSNGNGRHPKERNGLKQAK